MGQSNDAVIFMIGVYMWMSVCVWREKGKRKRERRKINQRVWDSQRSTVEKRRKGLEKKRWKQQELRSTYMHTYVYTCYIYTQLFIQIYMCVYIVNINILYVLRKALIVNKLAQLFIKLKTSLPNSATINLTSHCIHEWCMYIYVYKWFQ